LITGLPDRVLRGVGLAALAIGLALVYLGTRVLPGVLH
jgi:uncharacterized protein YjeT (DUF2065 family)